MMFANRMLYLTGLPTAGTDSLRQFLAQHPEIYCSAQNSPLCDLLTNFRTFVNENKYVTQSLNADFAQTYRRLLSGCRGFIQGWLGNIPQTWVVDTSPNCLQQIEFLHLIDPDFRMIVCVRELGQVYGNLEAQHQQTLLLDFPDNLAALSRQERAVALFAPTGSIGKTLKAMEALQDLEDYLQQRLYYVIFEHLMAEPEEVLRGIYQWLEIPAHTPELNQCQSNPPPYLETYGKYIEDSSEAEKPLIHRSIPPTFEQVLRQKFPWYYKTFYPGLV